MKYEPIVAVLNNLHIPLDSIILEIATNKENNLITKKQLKKIFNKETELENKDGQPAEFSWSRINSYPKYLEIQTILRKNLKDKKGVSIPILWEFDTWNESTEKE